MGLTGTAKCISGGVAIVALLAGLWWRKAAEAYFTRRPTTYYFFFTHHKTGTNLMQQVCNKSALALSNGKEQCAFCTRLIQGPYGVDCYPDPAESHGPLRGTVSRFTIVSSVGRELVMLDKFNVDFRAVHMIRHPEKMAISAHQYNKYVASEEGKKWRWDMSAEDIVNATSTREELEIEAKAINKVLVEMNFSFHHWANDPRVLTLDLDLFEKSFNESTQQLITHMFQLGRKDGQQLLDHLSAECDYKRWSKKMRRAAVTAPREVMNRSEAVAVWKQMEDEGQADVLKVKEFVHVMGFG